MTPPETLEKAIAKLERIAREKTQGDWDGIDADVEFITTIDNALLPLIAVLRDGLRWEKEVTRKGGTNRSQSDDLVVALAASVLESQR